MRAGDLVVEVCGSEGSQGLGVHTVRQGWAVWFHYGLYHACSHGVCHIMPPKPTSVACERTATATSELCSWPGVPKQMVAIVSSCGTP